MNTSAQFRPRACMHTKGTCILIVFTYSKRLSCFKIYLSAPYYNVRMSEKNIYHTWYHMECQI